MNIAACLRILHRRVAAAFVVALLTALVGTPVVRAGNVGTETILHTFADTTDGFAPTDLAQPSDGNLYGLTFSGPSGPVVFKQSTGGTFTALDNFCVNQSTCPNGANLNGLIAGLDGNLYSDAGDGGNNTFGDFFQVTPNGTITNLLNFTNVQPYPDVVSTHARNLVQGSDGNFYGTSLLGGANRTGALFKITPSGTLTLLHSFAVQGSTFTNADGIDPTGALVEGNDGNYYGVSYESGPQGGGTLYQITPSGTFTVIYAFSSATVGAANTNGYGPHAGMTVGTDGNFYGTTYYGGAFGFGTVFMITSTPDHTLTTLHSFGGSYGPSLTLSTSSGSVAAGQSTSFSWTFIDGYVDSVRGTHSLVLGKDGNFYGSGYPGGFGPGGIFEISPGGIYTLLYQFGGTSKDVNGNSVTDGSQGLALILGADGNFYGTTQSGGANDFGVIYKYSLTAAPPSPPCTASGAWSGAKPATGSVTVSQAAPGNYSYTLVCNSTSGGTVTKTFQLIVTPPAPVVTITPNPATVALGQSATLSWSSTNATGCVASGAWSGNQATSGTASVTPTAAGANLYTLACTGTGGTSSASATVTATAVVPPPAPTVSIAATPKSLTLGQSATLTWSSTNATACVASGSWSGPQSTGASAQLTPTGAGANVYTLTCTGPGGSASASATVTAALLVTSTNINGKAGGGGLGLDALAGLFVLFLARLRRQPFVLPRFAARSSIIAVAALAVGVLVSVPTRADDRDLGFRWDESYLGLRLGNGTYSESSGSLDGYVAGIGNSTTASHLTRDHFTGAAFAGVPFYRFLSLEVAVVDLGEYPFSLTTQSANATAAAQSIARHLPPAGRGLTLGLAAPIDLGAWFTVEPRLALLGYQSRQDVDLPGSSVEVERSGLGMDAGLSLLLHPLRKLLVGVGVDCFDTHSTCNVTMLSGQISYRFGP